MAVGSITPLQKLHHSAGRLESWIQENTPEASKAEQVFLQFMQLYGSCITGSPHFIAKTKKIIEKASRLAAGILAIRYLQLLNPFLLL